MNERTAIGGSTPPRGSGPIASAVELWQALPDDGALAGRPRPADAGVDRGRGDPAQQHAGVEQPEDGRARAGGIDREAGVGREQQAGVRGVHRPARRRAACSPAATTSRTTSGRPRDPKRSPARSCAAGPTRSRAARPRCCATSSASACSASPATSASTATWPGTRCRVARATWSRRDRRGRCRRRTAARGSGCWRRPTCPRRQGAAVARVLHQLLGAPAGPVVEREHDTRHRAAARRVSAAAVAAARPGRRWPRQRQQRQNGWPAGSA